MIAILAQAAETTAATTSTTSSDTTIWNRLDALAHPDKMVEALAGLDVVVASVLIAAGLVCLLQGFRIYKWAVILLALGLGGVLGYHLSHSMDIKAEKIMAGCLAILLAVVAWPLMKYAVAVAGGIAGAVIGANAWSGLADQINQATNAATISVDAYWAGALMGLIMFGLMAFILFEFSVVMFTSFSGATLAVLGAVALLLQVPNWQQTIADALKADPLIMPMLVIVPAIIGLVIQQQSGALKKPEPTEE